MRARHIAALLIVAATVVGLHAFCYRPYRQNIAIKKLEGISGKAHLDSNRNHAAGAARKSLEDGLKLEKEVPDHLSLLMLQALNYRILGNNEKALEKYLAAIKIQPRTEIYMNLADVQMKMDRRDDAIESIMIACRFDPRAITYVKDPNFRSEISARLQAR